MMKLEHKNIKLEFNKTNLHFLIQHGDITWQTDTPFKPYLETKSGKIFFESAKKIFHKSYDSGVGKGFLSHYEGFEIDGTFIPYSFETIVWIEEVTNFIYFEWIPLKEEGLFVENVYWPTEFSFDNNLSSWYSLIPKEQGLLIPNTWKETFQIDGFNGRFGTASAYMPWISQIKDGSGYLAICLTPWNAGYYLEHSGNSPKTKLGFRLENSLGKMSYKRILRYSFYESCDYNTICKAYREHVKETGKFKSLEEKMVETPSIRNLIGCSFVHKGIKTNVQPESDFFDPTNPEKNNRITKFSTREKEMEELHSLGVKKLYLHLDGWADPGYDNKHPDYLPACVDAGGWEGLRSLSHKMKELGYLFGIHDQYRDFYKNSSSYDDEFACTDSEGNILSHKRWAGGPQSYLVTNQAPFYVKRNFHEILSHDIHLDCAYLDVFTCNEGDESFNPRQKMTRKESYEFRNQCFNFLLSKNIIPSSEEVNDWAVPSLVFCHYAPYDFMLHEPGSPKYGLPVPLFNLVYHDCVIIPWMMEKTEFEDYMLYALLNGGAPYLIRDAAYPNIDGAFHSENALSLSEVITRGAIVSNLHEKVATASLTKHEFLDEGGKIQRSTFSNGYTVTVDFSTSTYQIAEPK